MPNKKTYIIFTISLILVLIMLSILTFVFLQIKSKNQQASIILQQINKKTTEGGNVETLKKVIEDTTIKRQQLKSYIVDDNHIDEFVSWIENEGDSIGVPITINSVSVSPTKKNILSVSFNGSGSFDKVMKTISLIEYSPYQIHINKLSLNKVTHLLNSEKIETIVTEWEFYMDIEAIIEKNNK